MEGNGMKNLPNELNPYCVNFFFNNACKLQSLFPFCVQILPMKDNRYRCVVLNPRPQTLPIITLPKRKNKNGTNTAGDQQGNTTVPNNSHIAEPGKG